MLRGIATGTSALISFTILDKRTSRQIYLDVPVAHQHRLLSISGRPAAQASREIYADALVWAVRAQKCREIYADALFFWTT